MRTKQDKIEAVERARADLRHGKDFLSRAEIEAPTPGELAGAATASKRRKRGKLSERAYLDLIRAEVSSSDIQEIGRAIVRRAKAGDSDALTWVGKYLLGGGRISLDEIDNPPVIRKTRGR